MKMRYAHQCDARARAREGRHAAAVPGAVPVDLLAEHDANTAANVTLVHAGFPDQTSLP